MSGLSVTNMLNTIFSKNTTGGKKNKKIDVKKSKKITSKKTSNKRYKGGAEGSTNEIDVNWGDKKYRCTELSEAVKVSAPPTTQATPATPALKTGGVEEPKIQTLQNLPNHKDEDITAALIKDIQASNTKIDSSQSGGKKTKRFVKNLSPKGQYKRFLEKMTLDKLQKISKKYNIKITTKKNGKTVNIKKESLVNKIVRMRYPSK
jgi:hypothetical protein